MQNNQNINNEGNQTWELRRLSDFLKSAVAENKLSMELATNYTKMAVELDNMSHKFDHYFTRNDDGKMPVLSLEAKETLLNHCKEIAKISEEITNAKPNSKFEKSLLATTNNIQDLISKDMRALIKVKEPQTLSSIIQGGRRRYIDISEQNTRSTGGNVSERVVIKDGEKDAFFTENKKWNSKKALEDFTKKYTENYPQYKKFFKTLAKTNLGILDADKIPVGTDIIWDDNRDDCNIDYNFSNTIKVNGLKDLFKEHIQHEDFKGLLYNFCLDAYQLNLQISMNDNILRLGKNEPIDERNAGMSVIAGLLGCNNLLAHAEPVTLIKNGKEINGTLMDKAEGIDLNNADLDDDARFLNNNALENTSIKKQLADLQVIDFICGNLDRHAGNMFLTFDKSNPNDIKATKLCGIDNDLSFTTLGKDFTLTGANYMSGLANLKVINEDMANKIMATTPAMMKLALRGIKIEDKAIDQCIKRFTMLQDMVKDRSVKLENGTGLDLVDTSNATKPEEAKINIIPEEKWKNITVTQASPIDLGENQIKNSFGVAQTFIKDMNADLKDIGRAMRSNLETTARLHHTVVSTKLDLNIQMNNLKSGNSIFRGTSEQYENIKRDLAELQKKQKALGGTPTHEQINDFCNDLNAAISSSQEYLDRKAREAEGGKKFGRYTKNRIAMMNQYNKFLIDKKAQLTGLVKKDENAKNHADKIQKLNAINGKIMNPEQVRTSLKSLENNVSKKVEVKKEDNLVQENVKGK